MMENEVIKAFNAELVSLYELKPPISKKKIVDITKAAMKAIKYYKHVVFGVEKFLTKCKQEYKIPGLYCIDSIIRQSRHQFKDKDVFGPRFAINMQITLSNLLSCKSDDKLKVVRVLNLWKSHAIFDSAKVGQWLNFCQDIHGLETDVVQVEKIVKGHQADFSIYGRPSGRFEKRKNDSHFSPTVHESRSMARTPPLPLLEPSDDAVDGGVSERETLAMLSGMGLDLGGMFSSDSALLQKVNKIVNDKLSERQELDCRRQGNIKNLLSKEFDYSDEEDSGDEEGNRKLQIENKPAELTKQQIIGMAEAVLRDPNTKEEIERMHTERVSALSQAAAARVQAVKQQQNIAAIVSAVTSSSVASAPVSIPLNPVSTAQQLAAPANIPVPAPILHPQAAQAIMSPKSAQQFLLNAAQGAFPAFTPNMPPPLFMGLLPPSQLPPANIVPSTGTMQSSIENDRSRRNDDKIHRDRDRGDRERRRDRPSRDRDDIPEFADSRAAKRSRRSRSRDRGGFSDMRHDRRSLSNGRRGPSHGRSDRERGDHENIAYRDSERQRRKMGLPWPPREGHVLIASCTLWIGRIPSNCSENDIRQAVAEVGEPSRVSIIHSRACAYVTMKDRKSAYRVIDRMQRGFEVAKKIVKLSWGIGQGLKGEKYSEFWDAERGITLIPYNKLPEDLEPLLEGGHLEVASLPSHLANLYDESGLKGRKVEMTSKHSAPPEMQISHLPQAFPFTLGQNQKLGGAPPPFLPPGVMPLPGMFPSALPPSLGSLPLPSGAPLSRSQTQNSTNTTRASSTVSVANTKAEMTASQNVGNQRMQMPGFDALGMNPFMPPNYFGPPPRFMPTTPSKFDGLQNMRHNRPPFQHSRGPYEQPFRPRQPYGSPLPRFPGVPSLPQRIAPQFQPQGHSNFQPKNDRGQAAYDQSVHSSIPPSSSHDEPDQSALLNITPSQGDAKKQPTKVLKKKEMGAHNHNDDTGDEPVSSTTHDDESNNELAAMQQMISASANSEDLKAVTQAEDMMLEHAIAYADKDYDD